MHSRITRNRREFIQDAFCGFGSLAVASMLHAERAKAAGSPLDARPSHRPAKAKAVIFLFMAGGPSQVDTFDPKPLLNKLHGQPRPKSFGEAKYQFVKKDARLLGTKRTFRKYGQSGIEVSDLFPHIAQCIDDIAVIRSMHADVPNHEPSLMLMNCGESRLVRPSMGSWLL